MELSKKDIENAKKLLIERGVDISALNSQELVDIIIAEIYNKIPTAAGDNFNAEISIDKGRVESKDVKVLEEETKDDLLDEVLVLNSKMIETELSEADQNTVDLSNSYSSRTSGLIDGIDTSFEKNTIQGVESLDDEISNIYSLNDIFLVNRFNDSIPNFLDDFTKYDFNLTSEVSNTEVSYNYIFGTTGDDNIIGTAGNDYIETYRGRDVMSGYQGNDVLKHIGHLGGTFIGGQGSDTLIAGGSSENNLFVFDDTAYTGIDTVIGFDVSHDKLKISDLLEPIDFLNIEDILNVVDMGDRTVIQVDADGLNGGSSGFRDVAVIMGLTGWTETMLETNNNLVIYNNNPPEI